MHGLALFIHQIARILDADGKGELPCAVLLAGPPTAMAQVLHVRATTTGQEGSF